MIKVFLAAYKGEAFLADQVSTILNQGDVDVELFISTDSSIDECLVVLEKNKQISSKMNQIHLIQGPQKGVNHNFQHLIQSSHIDSDDELFAFSDQDDTWLEDKLSAACTQLSRCQQSAVYMGRTTVCDETLKPLFLSKNKPKPASFKNALLESIAGGNTMVFNPATLALLKKVQHPVHHDWLTYMVVTACGGEVIFDDVPYVLYRQHAGNLIGANNSLRAKLYRFKKLLSNEFRAWATDNIIALTPLLPHMTADNQTIFLGFKRLHEMQGWYYCAHRLIFFQHLGLYRQRRMEHLGFMFAAFLGKI